MLIRKYAIFTEGTLQRYVENIERGPGENSEKHLSASIVLLHFYLAYSVAILAQAPVLR